MNTLGTIKDDLSNAETTSRTEKTRKIRSGPRTAYRPPTGHDREFYKQNVAGVLQIAGAAVFPASPADACAIIVHTPSLSESIADLAQQDSRVAAILDKLLEIGPYGALLSAVMPLVVQILANHGIIKPGAMGSMPAEEIIALVVGKPEPMDENKANGHANVQPDDISA
jgi:hypothetical protein